MLIAKISEKTPPLTSSLMEESGVATPPVATVSAPATPRTLKSILKVRDRSQRYTRSKSIGSAKKVSFSDNLTTVKKFDLSAEPISVSRDSPDLSPFLIPLDYSHHNGNQDVVRLLGFDYDEEEEVDAYDGEISNIESCWFNDVGVLPHIKSLVSMNGSSGRRVSDSGIVGGSRKNGRRRRNSYDFARTLEALDMDLYDESEDDSLELSPQRIPATNDYHTLLSRFVPLTDSTSPLSSPTSSPYGYNGSGGSLGKAKNSRNKQDTENYDLDGDPDYFKDWDLVSTNLSGAATFPNENNVLHDFLQGQSIKLRSITQLPFERNKLIGLLVVDNISYEKFVEVKFTFNNWSNINYLNAFFDRSLTDRYDQFKFILNLDSFKVFLKVKGLISGADDKLNIEFCCRYNVRNETYYDNNHCQNYKLTLRKRQHEQDLIVIPKESSSAVSGHTPLKATASKSHFSPEVVTDKVRNTKLSEEGQALKLFTDSDTVPPAPSRIFNDETDYFNTSPLKHFYHNNNNYYPDIWKKPIATSSTAATSAPSAASGKVTSSSAVAPESPQLSPGAPVQPLTIPETTLTQSPPSPTTVHSLSGLPALTSRLDTSTSTTSDSPVVPTVPNSSNFETHSIVTSSSDVSLSSNVSTDSTDSTLSSFQHDNEAASTIKKQNDFDYYAKFYSSAQPSNNNYLNLGDLDDHFYFWDNPTPTSLSAEKFNNISRDTIQAIRRSDQEEAEVETNDDQSNQTDSTLKNVNVCTTPNAAASNVEKSNKSHSEVPPNPTAKNIFDSSATNLDYQALLSSYCFYTPSKSDTLGSDDSDGTNNRNTFNRLAYITSLLD